MRNSICFRIVAMLLVAMLLATISGISEELPDAGDTLNEAPASVETMEMLEVMSVEDALDEAEQEFLSEVEPEEVASDALDTSEVKDEPALAYEPEDEGKQNAEISELADNTVEPALEEAEESQLVPDLPVETSPQNEDVLFVEEDASQKLEAEAAGGLPTSITLNASTVTLGKKERFQIVPQVNDGASAVFKYTVKNKKIASVTKNGMIRGKKPGRTKVIVKTQNGLKAKITVVVKKAPKKITVSPATLSLTVQQQAQLTVKLSKKSASTIQYITDNAGVAVVDANGIVTAVGAGTATITARTFNGKTARCSVAVAAPPMPAPVPASVQPNVPSATATPAPNPVSETKIDIMDLMLKSIAEANNMLPKALSYTENNRYTNGDIIVQTSTFDEGVLIKAVEIRKQSTYTLFDCNVGDNVSKLTTVLKLLGFSQYSNNVSTAIYKYQDIAVIILYSGSTITSITLGMVG